VVVDSLEVMESIVSSLPYVRWDGWDVVIYKRDNNGQFRSDGCLINGKWFVARRIVADRKGWTVPKSWSRHIT